MFTVQMKKYYYSQFENMGMYVFVSRPQLTLFDQVKEHNL